MLLSFDSRLSGLSEEAIQVALQVQEEIDRKAERMSYWRNLLDTATDQEIIRQTEAALVREGRPTIVTLANRYPNCHQPITGGGELAPYDLWHHPRRPVVMKGAKSVIIYKYSLGRSQRTRGLHRALLKRWISMKKPTLLDADDWRSCFDGLATRCPRKEIDHWYFRDGWLPQRNEYDARNNRVMIRGKWATLTASELQNVRRLHEIIKKTEGLEARMKMVRATSRSTS